MYINLVFILAQFGGVCSNHFILITIIVPHEVKYLLRFKFYILFIENVLHPLSSDKMSNSENTVLVELTRQEFSQHHRQYNNSNLCTTYVHTHKHNFSEPAACSDLETVADKSFHLHNYNQWKWIFLRYMEISMGILVSIRHVSTVEWVTSLLKHIQSRSSPKQIYYDTLP